MSEIQTELRVPWWQRGSRMSGSRARACPERGHAAELAWADALEPLRLPAHGRRDVLHIDVDARCGELHADSRCSPGVIHVATGPTVSCYSALGPGRRGRHT